MARFTVGSVPYVNAVPLIAQFEAMGEASPVRVVYEVPSALPALLESGAADAILVSSIDALRTPGRRMAEGVGIGSRQAVKSVRLFSKVPFEQIERLALDASSMTSNRLAQIVLHEHYGISPEARNMPSDLATMLAEADAAVLIGDKGMEADGAGLHVLDLGQAWRALTGLPFLWAGWIGGERLDPELAGLLQDALAYGLAHEAEVIRLARARSGWSEAMVRDYLTDTMTYAVDDAMQQGFARYGEYLSALELESVVTMPTWVPGLAVFF